MQGSLDRINLGLGTQQKHGTEYDDNCLLGCDAMQFGRKEPVVGMHMLPPSCMAGDSHLQ